MIAISGGVEPGKWACCNSAGQCSTPVYGDSKDLYSKDKGTVLTKKSLSLTESLD